MIADVLPISLAHAQKLVAAERGQAIEAGRIAQEFLCDRIEDVAFLQRHHCRMRCKDLFEQSCSRPRKTQ